MSSNNLQNFIREASPLYDRFQKDVINPQLAFQETWQIIYQKISGSSFWKNRGLKPNLEDNIVTNYEDYRIALEDAFSTALSPLNNEAVLNWTLSSGSSGPSKFFPVTLSYKRQVDEQHLCFMYEYLRRFPDLFREPIHYLATSGPFERNKQGVPVSYISNFNYRNLPISLRQFFGVPELLFENERDLARWRPVYMLAQNCSAIIAGAPAAVINIFEQIKTHSKDYYAYLSGELPLPSHLPPLSVPAERKTALAQSGLAEGKPVFELLWPDLQFIACWTSGICSIQAAFLRRFFRSNIPVIALPFASTEAWMNVCLSNSQSGGAINPRAALVEFSPLNKKESVALLKPWELEIGQTYEMYITNLMGLVRYRIKDVVECVGHYGNVAEISFVRKASQEISLAATTFNETELLSAIHAVPELKDSLLFFAPNEQGRGLTLFVASEECVKGSVVQKVEKHLFQINSVYRDDVQSGLLLNLSAKSVSPRNSIWHLSHAQAKHYIFRQIAPSDL